MYLEAVAEEIEDFLIHLRLSLMSEVTCQEVHFIIAGIIVIVTMIREKMRKTVGELCSSRKPPGRIISFMTVLIFAKEQSAEGI